MLIVPLFKTAEGVHVTLMVQVLPPARSLLQSFVAWKPGGKETELIGNESVPTFATPTVSGGLVVPISSGGKLRPLVESKAVGSNSCKFANALSTNRCDS